MREMSATCPTYPVAMRVVVPRWGCLVNVVMDVETEEYDAVRVHIKLRGGDWAEAEVEEGENPYLTISRLLSLLEVETVEACTE